MRVSEQYILEHFEEAVETGRIKAFFQPIIRTMTGYVCCAEALARWEDATYGLLSPADFIPVLERHDLIYRLDMAMLEQACAMYAHLRDSGMELHSFSVNFSRLDFTKPGFCEAVDNTLDAHRVPREAIKIEVTESVLLEERDRLQEVFGALQSAGYSVWVDDFGSGYSSLGMVQDYRFNLLKIDMVFMRNASPESRQLVAAIVKTAKSLGILTLIEGVETEEQAQFIRSIGGDTIQGFYWSRPLDANQLVEYLRENRVEAPDEKPYWNAICHFDLLTPNPFEEKRSARAAIQSEIPLALIECTWGKGDYIYANDAYLASVRSLGFDSIQALEHFYNDRISANYNPMKNLLTEAVLKDAVQEVDYVSGDVYFKFRAKCIAKSARLNRAMVVATLSTFKEDLGGWDRSELARYNQTLYASFDHVNLCFPEKNKSIRLFSKANFQTAHQLLGLRAGIQSFTQKEVAPDDRARYLRFFDMDTLEERLSEHGFIQQGFRIKDMDGNYIWKQVRITRVPSVVEKTYIYTIQAMSSVSARIAEMLVREHPEMLE